MAMRGTVYAMQEYPNGTWAIGRQVVQVDLATSRADFIAVVLEEQRPFPVGGQIAFGPIGPPWSTQ